MVHSAGLTALERIPAGRARALPRAEHPHVDGTTPGQMDLEDPQPRRTGHRPRDEHPVLDPRQQPATRPRLDTSRADGAALGARTSMASGAVHEREMRDSLPRTGR
jgi:hypothetical protein